MMSVSSAEIAMRRKAMGVLLIMHGLAHTLAGGVIGGIWFESRGMLVTIRRLAEEAQAMSRPAMPLSIRRPWAH